MSEIKCPKDLNQFILGEPIFENPFPEEECEKRKFYGDCYHCFSTAIASRDHQLKASVTDKIRTEIEELPKTYPFVNHFDMYVKEDDVKKIINKYMKESKVKK